MSLVDYIPLVIELLPIPIPFLAITIYQLLFIAMDPGVSANSHHEIPSCIADLNA